MTRFGYVMVTYFSIMGVAIASFIPTPTRLVWNVSASAPIGLYDIGPPGDLTVTDLVAVDPPKPLADFMVERGYIGRGSKCAASAAPSLSMASSLAPRSTATGWAANCRSGRAAAASPVTRYS